MTFQRWHQIVHNDKPVEYAILSHRWGGDEITFQDFQQKLNVNAEGWRKIDGFCSFIKSRGHRYCWMDTCCIDKSSSAELSESINSMFLWYKQSKICYVYLQDVLWIGNDNQKRLALRKSKWFTRGWTLQELLAPSELLFVDRNWNEIATKAELGTVISSITGIPNQIIIEYKGCTVGKPWSADVPSVSDVMSWAASRETTHEEDQAYSLLGLFGLYMSPMYGEGQNAFRRLQIQIIESCEDDTIFAWNASGSKFFQPLIAPHISHFSNCKFGHEPWKPGDSEPTERRITNKGLRLEPFLRPVTISACATMGNHLMLLNIIPRIIHYPGTAPPRSALIVFRNIDGKYYRYPAPVVFLEVKDQANFERQMVYTGLHNTMGAMGYSESLPEIERIDPVLQQVLRRGYDVFAIDEFMACLDGAAQVSKK